MLYFTTKNKSKELKVLYTNLNDSRNANFIEVVQRPGQEFTDYNRT